MASFNHYFFYKPKWQLKLAIFESLLYSTHYYNRLPVRSIIITVTFVTSSKLDYNKQLFPRLKLAIIIAINNYNGTILSERRALPEMHLSYYLLYSSMVRIRG